MTDMSRRALLQGAATLVAVPPVTMEVLGTDGQVLAELGPGRSAQDRLMTALSLYIRARERQKAAGAHLWGLRPRTPPLDALASSRAVLVVLSMHPEGHPCTFRWHWKGEGYVTFASHNAKTDNGQVPDFEDPTLGARWCIAYEAVKQANVSWVSTQRAVHEAAMALFGHAPCILGEAAPTRVLILDSHVFVFIHQAEGWFLEREGSIEHVTVLR